MVEREVWRTRVLQQNAHICIDLQPKFTNATMDFSSTVTCFGMDGIAGGILDSIPDKEATKVLLGKLISYAIGTNLLLNTPDNLKQYNPKITDIKFRNVNGKIYMLISGSFSSSPDQITNIISGAKR